MRSPSRLRRYGKRVFFVWLGLEIAAALAASAFGASWTQGLIDRATKPSLADRQKAAQELIARGP